MGAVLNFDNAGSSGPSVTYQTSAGNARLVDVFADIDRPLGSSLIDELARRGRVQSDFTSLREAGMPTMTFGLSEGFVRNHTPLDTSDRISPGSLQQQGEQALSAVRVASQRIADGQLSTDGESDVVYFPISRQTLVKYSRDLVLPLAVIVAVLYAVLLGVGIARRRLSGFSILSGAVNSLLTLVFMSAVTAGLWGFGWAGAAGGDASNPPYASDLLHRAGLGADPGRGRNGTVPLGLDREHAIEATLGAALWWLVLVFYVALALPGGSYLLVWPLLALLVSLAVVLSRSWPPPSAERQAWPAVVVLWAGTFPALLLFGSAVYLLFTVSEMRLVVVLLSTWLLLGALLPSCAAGAAGGARHARRRSARWGSAIVVGLSPATGLADDPPAPVQAFYRYDVATLSADWGRYFGALRSLRPFVSSCGRDGPAPGEPVARRGGLGRRGGADRRAAGATTAGRGRPARRRPPPDHLADRKPSDACSESAHSPRMLLRSASPSRRCHCSSIQMSGGSRRPRTVCSSAAATRAGTTRARAAGTSTGMRLVTRGWMWSCRSTPTVRCGCA